MRIPNEVVDTSHTHAWQAQATAAALQTLLEFQYQASLKATSRSHSPEIKTSYIRAIGCMKTEIVIDPVARVQGVRCKKVVDMYFL